MRSSDGIRQELRALAATSGASTPGLVVRHLGTRALADWALALQSTVRVWLDGGSFDRDIGLAIDRTPHAFVFQPFSQANPYAGQNNTGCAVDGAGVGCWLATRGTDG